MAEGKFDAVVLAGSENTGKLQDCSSEANEAMIRIGDKPMVQYVVEALLSSKNIGRIIIVGPPDVSDFFSEPRVEVAEPADSVTENLLNGFARADCGRPILIVSSDLPLLTAEAVDNLFEICDDPQVDFYYPIVPMNRIEQTFPGTVRTSVRVKEGLFTGGNIFLVNPAVVPPNAAKVQEFIDYRKSPLQLCRILGIKFVVKFLANRLTIPELEEKISEIFNINARAVITMYPEIGLDVDKDSDYTLVSHYLEKSA